MKAVLQRVTKASVTIENKIHSNISKGLLILLGIAHDDTLEDIKWLIKKITDLRIFNDDNAIMNLSLKDIKGEALIISQFTLMARTKKGNRPSYMGAAKPEIAIPLYKQFITLFEKEIGKKVGTGVFGADMKIDLLNDGPVTIIIDSKNRK
jgi:D-aminoacyl-tRNA deacylase